eukprot:436864-Pyramimonas_sp.AAC.1
MFPRAVLPMLPESDQKDDQKWRFATCAVVGNSGRLLGGDAGAEIDGHEVRASHSPPIGIYPTARPVTAPQ